MNHGHYNEVFHYPGGGRLYQGQKECLEDLKKHPRPLVVLVCAAELQDLIPKALRATTFFIPLDDVPLSKDNQVIYAKALQDVVRQAASALVGGQDVVTVCNMGLNRSGLLAGLTLRRLGVSGPEAVKSVRKARGSYALSNKSFEEMVLR